MTVEFPIGFSAYYTNVGIKDNSPDFAIAISFVPCTASALFTRNRFAGPSVQLSQKNIVKPECIRGIVAISKNANVATGKQGMENALEILRTVPKKLGLLPNSLLLASTGKIGQQYPMEKIRKCISNLGLDAFTAGVEGFARAIMTTDTRPKIACTYIGDVKVVGIAKGIGMIEPNMATLFGFIFTDAAIEQHFLDEIFRYTVEHTFNCLSIDTDTSTSDTAIVLANGAKGKVSSQAFSEALHDVCLDLTKQIAADGEGATKVIKVEVSGSRDFEQARRVAKAIVNSPLVKTAVHGADPNWGRVAMAIGKCYEEVEISPDKTSISIGEVQVYPGNPDEKVLSRITDIMKAKEVVIGVNLGIGSDKATVWGCDLSEEYIKINADYTS